MTELQIFQAPGTLICPKCGNDPEPRRDRWWRRDMVYHTYCPKFYEPHIHVWCSHCGYDYGFHPADTHCEVYQDLLKARRGTRRAW